MCDGAGDTRYNTVRITDASLVLRAPARRLMATGGAAFPGSAAGGGSGALA